MLSEQTGRTVKFLCNGYADPETFDGTEGAVTARRAISKAMNAKRIAFLLGAGWSSLIKAGDELGISTIAPLAKEFCGEALAAQAVGHHADLSLESALTEVKVGGEVACNRKRGRRQSPLRIGGVEGAERVGMGHARAKQDGAQELVSAVSGWIVSGKATAEMPT